MTSKIKPKKRILKTIVSFFLLVIVVAIFSVPLFLVPEELRMIAGIDHKFQLNLPVQAKIIPAKEGVLKVNNKPVTDNINISLRKPFIMESSETGTLDMYLHLFGMIPIKKMTVDIMPNIKLIPCGKTVAVRIQTDGIMVLGTGVVHGSNGEIYEPSKGILESGDLILEINEIPINTIQQLIEMINNSSEKPLKIKIKREEELIETLIQPVKSEDQRTYKLGVWVRDSTQGIGTVTYINPNTMTYGALGHGITDIDTKQLIPIRTGTIMETEITSIRKGKKGLPGELSGTIIETSDTILGNVDANTQQGIFGVLNLDQEDVLDYSCYPIGLQHEVEEGPAIIRTNISGSTIEEFTIDIQKIIRYHDNIGKGMIIKITDPRLLSQTNGIIQGMSGSPIIQNDKIIGAVTHVFVQEPSKGYGIFIENMLKREKDMENTGKIAIK
ncbi:MAG: SpoIVB peptidase [Epulopiscium sp.]|nr:SpoIVB peptidase [Candidatus Epulonipiscium sp.]